MFNLWSDASYDKIKDKMLRVLEEKMEDIGDVPAHPIGLSSAELARMYVPGKNISAKAEQHNM